MEQGYEVSEEGRPVKLPSGAIQTVLTPSEVDYLTDRVRQYTATYKWDNISDVADIDRILVMELLVYRWGLWISMGKDYFGDDIDEANFRKSIKEYCVDENTEALTREGWMSYQKLAAGSRILTLNVGSGLSEWQPIEALNVFDGERPMRVFDHLWHKSSSTQDHRWWTERPTKRSGQRTTMPGFRTTAELDCYDRLPMAVPCSELPLLPTFSDSFVEIMAWWWTEGTYHTEAYHCVDIAQSHRANPTKVDRIRSAFFREWGSPGPMRSPYSGTNWNETTTANGMTHFKVRASVARETLGRWAPGKQVTTEFLHYLTGDQLRLFLDVSILADGWFCHYATTSGRSSARAISQRRREGLDFLQMVASLAGIATNLYYEAGIDMWHLSLMKKTKVAPAIGSSTLIPVEGPVWCPTVANGIWLARREGTVFYTGNSMEIRQVKGHLGMDRVTREKDNDDSSVHIFLANLRQRAMEFGIMREEQCAKAIELSQTLIALWQLYTNCDVKERREQRCDAVDIVDWIGDVYKPQFQAIDEHFRSRPDGQKYWTGTL